MVLYRLVWSVWYSDAGYAVLVLLVVLSVVWDSRVQWMWSNVSKGWDQFRFLVRGYVWKQKI